MTLRGIQYPLSCPKAAFYSSDSPKRSLCCFGRGPKRSMSPRPHSGSLDASLASFLLCSRFPTKVSNHFGTHPIWVFFLEGTEFCAFGQTPRSSRSPCVTQRHKSSSPSRVAWVARVARVAGRGGRIRWRMWRRPWRRAMGGADQCLETNPGFGGGLGGFTSDQC